MAKRCPTPDLLQVHVEYLFDRLHDSKLAQAYSLPVPIRERPVGGSVKKFDHEDGSDLRTSIVRPTAGSAHDSEPDGVADRVCPGARSGGAQGVGLRR